MPVVVVVTRRPAERRRCGPGGDALADALAEARALRRAGVALVVVDAAADRDRGCGTLLAETGGGIHLRMADVSSGLLLDDLARIA